MERKSLFNTSICLEAGIAMQSLSSLEKASKLAVIVIRVDNDLQARIDELVFCLEKEWKSIARLVWGEGRSKSCMPGFSEKKWKLSLALQCTSPSFRLALAGTNSS